MIRAAVQFFFSGALALVYEVLWQRRFARLFGGRTARGGRRPGALGPSERAAMEPGDWLFEFSLALAEQDDEAAPARLRLLLPAETYAAVFPTVSLR